MLPIFYDFVLFRDSCILKLFVCQGPEKPRPRLTGYLWLLPALLTPPPMAELPFPPQASLSYITLPFWLLALLVLLLVPNSPSPLPLSSFSLALPCPTSLMTLSVCWSNSVWILPNASC